MTAQAFKIANVIIPFADQDKALTFYTEALGLEVRLDVPFGNNERWIEVAPKGADTTIAICPPGPQAVTGGKDTGITLATADIDGYHSVLKERGVDVDAEVARFGDDVPPMFWFRDNEGNVLLAVEVR